MQQNNDLAAHSSGGAQQVLATNNISLQEFVSIVFVEKWLIVCTLLAFAVAAFIYVETTPPVYQADSLIQVEEDKPALSGLAGLTDVLPSESAIGAEIEIVRSRRVLGQVVEELSLTTSVEPYKLPFIGDYIFRKNGQKNQGAGVNLPMLGRFAWGGESLDIRRIDSGDSFGEINFVVEIVGNGRVRILKNGVEIAVGVVGEAISLESVELEYPVLVNIRSVVGDVGKRFRVSHVSRLAAINRLRERISVTEVGRDTGVMRLRIEGEDPVQIERIIESISNNYIRQNIERRSAEAQQSLSFLNGQLPEVKAGLEAAEGKLAEFREMNKTIDLTIETESVLQNMVMLDQRVSELDLRRAELTRNYTDDHPVVQTIDEQRSQLIREKAQLEETSSDLPDVQQDLLRYMREVEVATQLYTFMLNKIQELRVVEAGTVGNVRVIDTAAVLPDPVSPRAKYVLAMSFIMAAFAAGVVVVLKRLLNRGLSDPEEVERELDVSVYSVLPFSENTKTETSSNLIVEADPGSIIAESFRSLRTSIHFGMGHSEGCKVIAVSGPAPNVGKTFVSTNLAITLANAGHKVLYVDGDMRRGDGDKMLKVNRAPGLSNLLASDGRDVLQEYRGCEGLSVVARGKSPPNPAEIVMNGRLQTLIEQWKSKYDFILLDTPPVLAVTDPVVIAKCADALFLIGRAGKTTISELKESKNRFSKGGVSVAGVVINGMTSSLASGGQYGYGYYNYSYESTDD